MTHWTQDGVTLEIGDTFTGGGSRLHLVGLRLDVAGHARADLSDGVVVSVWYADDLCGLVKRGYWKLNAL